MPFSQADTADAYANITGVVFKVTQPDRTMKVHISFEKLRSLHCFEDQTKFVRENPQLMQRLVDEALVSGWTGPMNWML